MDAIGLYANINTKHAMKIVRQYLEKFGGNLKDFTINTPFILNALNK